MLYLFGISKKRAFRICMGWGGGRRPYIFGNQGTMFCFQDFGLFVQNTQDTNWGLGENRA